MTSDWQLFRDFIRHDTGKEIFNLPATKFATEVSSFSHVLEDQINIELITMGSSFEHSFCSVRFSLDLV